MNKVDTEQFLRGKLALAYSFYGPYYARNLSHLIRLEFPNASEKDILLVGAFLKFEELIQK